LLHAFRLLRFRLGLGQPRAELHLLVDERARPALGQGGLATEEVEERPRAALLGEREGLLRLLRLEGQMDSVLVDPELALDDPAAEVGVGQVRADLLYQAHRLPRRDQRLVDAAEALERTCLAQVEARDTASLVDLGGKRDALLVQAKRLRPVLSS